MKGTGLFFQCHHATEVKDNCLKTTARKKETNTTFILKQVQKCTKILKRANKYDSHLIMSKSFSLVQRDDSREKVSFHTSYHLVQILHTRNTHAHMPHLYNIRHTHTQTFKNAVLHTLDSTLPSKWA